MLFDLMCKWAESAKDFAKTSNLAHTGHRSMCDSLRTAKLFTISGVLPDGYHDGPVLMPFPNTVFEATLIAGQYKVPCNIVVLVNQFEQIPDEYDLTVMSSYPSIDKESRELSIDSGNIHTNSEGKVESSVLTIGAALDLVTLLPTMDTYLNDAGVKNNPATYNKHYAWFNSIAEYIVKVARVIASPKLHIVKECPRNPRTGKLIPRSHERPKYTVLDINQIQTRYNLGYDHGGTKASHFRRAHYRVLRSDKFINKQGQTINVKSTWIGPSECTINGKRYQVILDPLADN